MVLRRLRHRVKLLARRTRLVPDAEERGHSSTDWEGRWGDAQFVPAFEIDAPDPAVRAAVADGWFTPGMRAIDIGCGAGHNAAWLANQAIEAVGVDFAEAAIARATAAHGESPTLSYRTVDVSRPGIFVGDFDALIDRGCLHGIEAHLRPGYVENLLAWSHIGSRLLLIMKLKRKTPQETQAEAMSLLGSSFELISSDETDFAGPTADMPIHAVAMRIERIG